MSDLVKRLRQTNDRYHIEVRNEAADEIEGLLGLLCAARDELEFWTPIEAGATPLEAKSLASYYKLRDQIDATIRASDI